MKYDGLRFRATCTLAGKLYGQRFGVDVAFGVPIFGQPETIVADDVLGFAGITPPAMRVYLIETHIAEKLHAYTLPRKRPNSGIKELPDIALLASIRAIEMSQLRSALDQTFSSRATHEIPKVLEAPPTTWTAPYVELARNDQLPWAMTEDLFAAAHEFLGPMLSTKKCLSWDPLIWAWN